MKSLLTMGILSVFLSLFSCTNKATKADYSLRAKQIKITGLKEELNHLKQGKTEYDFIGITSNGIDCIYFMNDGDKFQIEFEAMTESQIPFIDKLKAFASQNGYESEMTTYGNKPQYNSPQAPVLKIRTNSNLEESVAIGQEIQRDVFGNGEHTVYEVVP